MNDTYLTLLCLLLQPSHGVNDVPTQLQSFSNIEWDELIDLASQYNLLPFIYSRLKTLAVLPDIPENLHNQLRTAYLTNATRNTLLLNEAEQIFRELEAFGIPAIGLKGLYLLENIYEDIGMRQMSDLDIMLHKENIPHAIIILETLGYSPTTYFDIKNENIDIKHVPPLLKEQGPYYVELHWTILEENEPFNIDAEGLWERAIPTKIAGVDALALSPEDLVLHLCLHLTYQHHLNIGLRGLYDIAAVLHYFKGKLNWNELVEIARSWGAERVARLTFSLAEDLLGSEIPTQVLDHLAPEDIEPWVLTGALSQLLQRELSLSPMTPDLAQLASEKNIFKRVKLVISRVLLPKHTLARLYNVPPDSLQIYGCYVRRLVDLIRSYVPTITRIFTSDETIFTDVKSEKAVKNLKIWMIEK